MDSAGNQRKRTSVWRIPALSRCKSAATTPPKSAGFEKRRLSIRSENRAVTPEAARTAATSAHSSSAFSFSRQGNAGLTQQSGKENQVPFPQQDDAGETRGMLTRPTTNKRKKSSNPYATGRTTDPGKRIARRRLSGDYEVQLPAKKLERQGVTPLRFSVYDDEGNGHAAATAAATVTVAEDNSALSGVSYVPGGPTTAPRTEIFESGPSTITRGLYSLWKSYQRYESRQLGDRETSMQSELTEGTSETNRKEFPESVESRRTRGPEFLQPRSTDNEENSGAEFSIERVDSDAGAGWKPAMWNRRKAKSGSDIGLRLKIAVRRGDDISPLKRRINQLNRSTMIAIRSSAGTGKVGPGRLMESGGAIGFGSAEEVRRSASRNAERTSGSPGNGALTKSNKSSFQSTTGNVRRESRSRRRLSKSLPRSCSSTSVRRQRQQLQQQRRNSAAGRAATADEAELTSQIQQVVPRFCQPALGDKTFDLRDDFLKLESTSGVFRDLPLAEVDGGRTRAPFEDNAWRISRNRTSADGAAAAIPPLHSEGAGNDRSFVSHAKKVRPNREAGSHQESQSIKHAGKVSGLLCEIPFEIQYTTDYTGQTIDIEQRRVGCCDKVSRQLSNGRDGRDGRVVTPEQRRIVVNFLISVHAYLLTSSSTLHQATKMFDAILNIKDVSVEELQLVALGTLWIAIKNMETRVPTASEMISFAKDMYHAEGPRLLCKCERKILKTLGFGIRFSDPFYISACYLQRWLPSSGTAPANDQSSSSIRQIIYHCAGYLMDVALLDENYSGTPGRLLAAAATQTAARLVLGASDLWNVGTSDGYCTREEIEPLVDPMLKAVLDSAVKDSPTGAVYKKYKNARYDNTSDYLVMKVKELQPGI